VPWKPASRTHARPREPHTKSTTERGYGWDWRRFRINYLAEHPLCVDCLPIVTPATELHHIEKIKDAPHKRLDWDNIIPLCDACHNRRTAKGE
jgi:5-methylcytosine-specific restriction protein A